MEAACRKAAEVGERARAIDEVAPDCACEKHSLSDASPGPVKDDETLVVFVTNPLDVDPQTGQPSPRVFQQARTVGVSGLRDFAPDAEIRTEAVSVVERKTLGGTSRSLVAVLIVPVSAARRIQQSPEDARRAYCVYDTARSDCRSHADICQVRCSRNTERRQRHRLWELCKDRIVSLHAFRGGLLADLAVAP